PVIVWHNATVAYRDPAAGRGFGAGAGAAAQAAAAANANGADDPNAAAAGAGAPVKGRGPALPRVSLRSVVTEAMAKKLNFGASPDGSKIGPDDFAAEASVAIEIPVPAGKAIADFQVDAEVGADRDQVFRIIMTDREDGSSRGIPVRAILGDPKSSGYQAFKNGVLQLADVLPPNANGEPTPADKDPPPEPFDPTYNVPEHDAFDNDVKYVRDDRFIYQHVLDDQTRRNLDQAW